MTEQDVRSALTDFGDDFKDWVGVQLRHLEKVELEHHVETIRRVTGVEDGIRAQNGRVAHLEITAAHEAGRRETVTQTTVDAERSERDRRGSRRAWLIAVTAAAIALVPSFVEAVTTVIHFF